MSNLTLLVTTRETLRVQGELELEVPPLAAAEAIELFCVRSGGEPSNDIAELCARLDSLPLAIELAAARTRILTPRQMLDRFPQLLDIEGARDADARQRTLRASIRWSYDLLSDDEQGAFRRLAVLEGATLETAEEAAATDSPPFMRSSRRVWCGSPTSAIRCLQRSASSRSTRSRPTSRMSSNAAFAAASY